MHRRIDTGTRSRIVVTLSMKADVTAVKVPSIINRRHISIYGAKLSLYGKKEKEKGKRNGKEKEKVRQEKEKISKGGKGKDPGNERDESDREERKRKYLR